MFEIAKQQVKLIKVSVPMENHGKEKKAAVVLTVEAALSNKSLNQLSPGLCEALYRKATKEDGADLASDPDGLTVRRHPKIQPFDLDHAGTGYKAVVDYGLGGDSNIELSDAKVDAFQVSPLEGGTYVCRFNIHGHTDELTTGRLCFRQKQDIDLILTPPAATTVQELFGDDKKKPKGKDKKEANLAEAQAMFVAGGEKAPEGDAKQVLNPAAGWPFPKDSKPAAA
jgi:hypothetical protein